MTYRAIQGISNVAEAIEDWKRDMITDEKLAEKFNAGYKALKEGAEVLGTREEALNEVSKI